MARTDLESRSDACSAPTASAARPAVSARSADGPPARRGARARAAARRGRTPRLLVGRDTRESGAWIEAELAHGASGEGAQVTSAGVVPTPAVAYLTRTAGYDAGVVISASHNPFEDNGIKVFSGGGEKFTERVEREVEAIVADSSWTARGGDAGAGAAAPTSSARISITCARCCRTPRRSGGFRLGDRLRQRRDDDRSRRALFASLGFDTVVIGNQPDGRNINLRLRVDASRARWRGRSSSGGCQLGVAFDGDGDRAIFVDHRGRIVNGDAVLLMCARQLQREGRLKGDAIVATVMSNIGLELALQRRSASSWCAAAVGDKYVMEEMLARGLSLGGEQSGHVIFSDYLFTGDGLCTALNVLRTMAAHRPDAGRSRRRSRDAIRRCC